MTAQAKTSELPDLRTAHVIVVANEKGGTGKSTLSIHISIALLKAGFRVATIDLDTRQRTLTRFFENRASWAATAPWNVELPVHHALDRSESENVRDNETAEFGAFASAIAEVEHEYEFVVIDTPASDSYLMRLAHSLADTLVSPINDSSSTSMSSPACTTIARSAARSPNMPTSCSRHGASAGSSIKASSIGCWCETAWRPRNRTMPSRS